MRGTEIPKRTKDKVCITGFAPSKTETPFGDDSFERWGINELYLELPFANGNWTRWFDVHSDLQERAIKSERCRDHLDRLEKIGKRIPLYMMHRYDKTPSAKQFPHEELMDEYGDYFTNSISWLIALAIKMEFKEIWIVGVDMATGTEYASQRPSCEYFIGLARGMGITVRIPPTSDLCKTHEPYGLGKGNFVAKLTARGQELETRKHQHESERAKADSAFHQMVGRVEELTHTLKSTNPPDEVKSEMEKRIANLRAKANEYQQQKQNHMDAINQLEGAIQNNLYILSCWTTPLTEVSANVDSQEAV